MQRNVKKWMWLLLAAPAMAMAQQSAPLDADKKAAIKDLLDAIDSNKLVAAIGEGAQAQAKQMAIGALQEQLVENKTLSDAQKQAIVPVLQQNSVQKLVDNAGKVFASDAFKNDAVQAQYSAYGKYYTTDEIKGLTAFYKSPVGQKYIKVQDQVGQEVVGGLMQKYMPQSIDASKKQADAEIAAAAKSVKAPAKK
ncbi:MULTISPECIES: DUF2059 domain-containing protein [Pandoraea]|uniref:DUF2059 domain-containing protein n=1 Tax=Pandoraea communis TaxID=2508297 RepID=A0A5E4YNM7_9BURK|nr:MULTISPECIES: DUF2059 domain-containing protein [Pandoraea]EON14974.1 hypothetical protein C266_02943 [Pandoraea sp. SD6-2]MDM8358949.1 DUF2059 domain-containing protein [Pandoraea communis]VVE50005.1 hypothetical protein PCO31111_04661 [Pandoraea communis]VVE55015.1 hypothetical protein PCO31110_05020 [Pandoraea communis]